MLTTTHVLMAAVAGNRRNQTGRQIAAAWLGGIFPDLSTFVMYAVGKLPIWGERINLWRAPDGWYWNWPWRTLDTITNSMPLYFALAALGYWLWRSDKVRSGLGLAILVFAAGAFLHCLVDFLTHASDPHEHFWPFSNWQFFSPVSYYQSSHYGAIMRPVDIGIGVLCAIWLIYLFRRRAIVIPVIVLAGIPFLMMIARMAGMRWW